MFSSVFAIDLRMSLRTKPMRRSGFSARDSRDVPALAHPRAAAHGLELVAPDRAAEDLAHEVRRARLPGNAPVVLELDHGVGGRVRDAALHAIPNLSPSFNPLRAVLRVVHRARAVDVVVAARIGEQGEDRLRRARGSRARRSRMSAGFGHRRSVGCPNASGTKQVRASWVRPQDRRRHVDDRTARRRVQLVVEERRIHRATSPTSDHHDRFLRPPACPRSTRCPSRSRRAARRSDQGGDGQRPGHARNGVPRHVLVADGDRASRSPVTGLIIVPKTAAARRRLPGRDVGPRHQRHGRLVRAVARPRRTTCRSRTICSTRAGRSRRATTKVKERPGSCRTSRA